VSIGEASFFRASSSFFHFSSSVALAATSSTTLFFVATASPASFSIVFFSSLSASTNFLVYAFTSTSVASSFSPNVFFFISFCFFLGIFNLCFLLSNILFIILNLFLFLLLFLAINYSSSTDSKCVDIVSEVTFSIASYSFIFWDYSWDFSSSIILPISFPFLLNITSSYFLELQWTSSSSYVSEVYSHECLYLL